MSAPIPAFIRTAETNFLKIARQYVRKQRCDHPLGIDKYLESAIMFASKYNRARFLETFVGTEVFKIKPVQWNILIKGGESAIEYGSNEVLEFLIRNYGVIAVKTHTLSKYLLEWTISAVKQDKYDIAHALAQRINWDIDISNDIFYMVETLLISISTDEVLRVRLLEFIMDHATEIFNRCHMTEGVRKIAKAVVDGGCMQVYRTMYQRFPRFVEIVNCRAESLRGCEKIFIEIYSTMECQQRNPSYQGLTSEHDMPQNLYALMNAGAGRSIIIPPHIRRHSRLAVTAALSDVLPISGIINLIIRYYLW